MNGGSTITNHSQQGAINDVPSSQSYDEVIIMTEPGENKERRLTETFDNPIYDQPLSLAKREMAGFKSKKVENYSKLGSISSTKSKQLYVEMSSSPAQSSSYSSLAISAYRQENGAENRFLCHQYEDVDENSDKCERYFDDSPKGDIDSVALNAQRDSLLSEEEEEPIVLSESYNILPYCILDTSRNVHRTTSQTTDLETVSSKGCSLPQPQMVIGCKVSSKETVGKRSKFSCKNT